MALFDRVEVVLFDLDGTLAATHEILFETYVRFMTAQGGVPSRDEFAGLDGPTITEIVQLLRSRHGLSRSEKELDAVYRDILRERYPLAPAAAGAELALAALGARVRLGLVTAAPADLADALLERRGWKALFAVVVTGDLGPAKPAPDLYRLALRLLGVEPAVALAVEDSPAGVEAATAAGLRTVGVAPSPPAAARLEQAGAAATVVHLGELPGLVA